MVVNSFHSMAAAVDAARTVRFCLRSRAEAAVADFVFERSAGKVVVKVLERRPCDVGKRLVSEERLMRSDDYVRHRDEQRERLVLPRHVGSVLVEPFAFLLVDVEPRGADRAVAQPRQKRLGINEAAARRIDEREAALRLRESRGVDQVPRVGEEGTVERDDVRLGEEPVERHVFEACGGVRECVVGEHAHPETLADFREDASDLARAYDASRLAVQVESGQPGEREVEVARPRRRLVDVAVERKEQRGGVLRDGIRRVGRDAHDREARLERRIEVDVVVARAPHREHLDAARDESLHDGAVDLGVHERARRVAALGERKRRRREPRLEILDLVAPAVELVERLAVVGLRVEKCDLFH